MKTIFDTSTRQELSARINSLHGKSEAQWGKMNVYQMLTHVIKWDDMMFGKTRVNRVLLGRIFGKWALKNVLKNEKPLGKNSPTVPELIIKETTGDVTLQKAEWIKRIQAYAHYDNPDFVHPFFLTSALF